SSFLQCAEHEGRLSAVLRDKEGRQQGGGHEGAGRDRLPSSDRGGMGVCVPGQGQGSVLLRRRRLETDLLRMVQRKFRSINTSCWRESPECLRPPRHAWKRLGVVLGLRQTLFQKSKD